MAHTATVAFVGGVLDGQTRVVAVPPPPTYEASVLHDTSLGMERRITRYRLGPDGTTYTTAVESRPMVERRDAPFTPRG